MAEKEGIDLRQSYTRTLGQLMIDQRFREHPKRKRKAMAAARKIKTIAGRLVRDVERSLDAKDRLDAYDEQLWLYYRMMKRLRQIRDAFYFVLDLLTGNQAVKKATVQNY